MNVGNSDHVRCMKRMEGRKIVKSTHMCVCVRAFLHKWSNKKRKYITNNRDNNQNAEGGGIMHRV
jgi:hypothetical protein